MEDFTAILEAVDAGDLSAFTDEQLTEAATKIKEYGRSLLADKPTEQDIADAKALKSALEVVSAEQVSRETKATEQAAAAADALSAFADDVTEPEPVAEPVVEPEPAKRPSAAEVARRRPPQATPQPEPAQALVAAALEAQDQIGTRFKDQSELADAMHNAWTRQGNGTHPVARIPRQHKYQLGGDPIGNFDTLQAIRAASQDARNEGLAITAALGCAPTEPVYDFFSQSGRGAGIWDGPSATARRGSRTYPPVVGQPQLVNQTGIGTQYTGASKTCFTVACGTTRETDVVANFTCLTFDNEEGLFYPELVSHYTSESLITHEHEVNQRIIENIRDSAITTTVHDLDTLGGTVVGLIRAVARTRAYYIQRHKMPESSVVDVLFPYWFGAAYAADIAARPTDFGQAVSLGLARITADFRQIGAAVQWLYDWQESAAEGFDDHGSFLLYAPGTFVRLDGPTLDLGVVRDSTLNAANDFQTFFESWTGLADVGNEALYVQGVETCPSGATGSTAAIACGAS